MGLGPSQDESESPRWPALVGNPLLEAHRQYLTGGRLSDEDRDELIHHYAFAICDDEALSILVAASPSGIVELGAGTGYWARLLHERGVDVVAFDVAPPPSPANRWFAGQPTWYSVQRGDETSVSRYTERTLLMVWPTRNETWPAETLEAFHEAGGNTVCHVGQGPGGRTGDDRFLAMLGAYDRCYACAYDLHDTPCICGTPVLWRLTFEARLPSWSREPSHMRIYRRAQEPTTAVAPKPETPRRIQALTARIRRRHW